jgi:2-desacetyl-2-hydroxyethyl bacteriochlorophyllide A dehydrogenase
LIINRFIVGMYLLINQLGLTDTVWALTLPHAFIGYYLVITRNFFRTTIPDSIEESARMDGASDFKIWYRIYLPLSIPVLATVAIWEAVYHWNEYFDAMIFMNDRSKYVLQVILRRILVENQLDEFTTSIARLYSAGLVKPTDESMKAAILEGPGKLTVRDIPMRVCKKDEVLVKVKACGICGSDLRYMKGENPWALHTLGRHQDNPSNMILGHEFAGEVVEVGDPANKKLIGKRVFVEPYNTCGMCEFCRTGRYNLCRDTKHIGHSAGWSDMDYFPGGMAEYCQVWATHVYELPENISYEEATVLDPLAVAIHAVDVSRFTPGSDVLVLGSGPVGLCIAQVVKAYGAPSVFCTDIYKEALTAASVLGADHPLDVRETDTTKYVTDKTKGRGVDFVFDTVGSPESQKEALRLLAASGTLVNLVANSNTVELQLLALSGERCIRGTSNNLYQDVLTGIKLMSAGLVKAKPMISHQFALADVNKGFDLLYRKEKTGAVKIVIIP